jgi:8-oxo-dGTP pyrophosphatase MutT (NUDIX family)
MRRDVASIILYDTRKRVLIQQRDGNTDYYPYAWSLFGGGLEKKETGRAAMKRETYEELRYRLKKPELVWKGPYKTTNQGRLIQGIHYLYAERYDGKQELVLCEGKDMAWKSIDDILKIKKFMPEDRRMMLIVLENQYQLR